MTADELRALDARVAVEVMGWTTYEEYVHGPMMHGGAITSLYRGSKRNGTTQSVGSFRPSSDIFSAWLVVENMAERYWKVSVMNRWAPHVWGCCVIVDCGLPTERQHFRSSEEGAPHAICEAALAALSTVAAPTENER